VCVSVCVCVVLFVCTYAHVYTYTKVDIISTDDTEAPPTDFQGYPITYTSGFRFSLYPIIALSLDHQLKVDILDSQLCSDFCLLCI
jgi:hypothetical protein